MKEKRFYIYCDESIKKGAYYSNFYGGALIDSNDYKLITDVLSKKKDVIMKTKELKWQKISKLNFKQYIDAIDTFLDFVQSGKVKIRIMFRPNRIKPIGLTSEQKRDEYFLLYYQFLKHAFGLRYMESSHINNIEIFLDNIPDKKEKSLFITSGVCSIYHNLLMQESILKNNKLVKLILKIMLLCNF